MSRNKLIVGNWKLHGSLAQCRASVPRLTAALRPEAELAICPPALYLAEMATLTKGTGLGYGAQDVSAYASGAYTGEIAAGMLAELGGRYAIVGHSERRQYHNETDQLVAAKSEACAAAGVTPIVCIGETGPQRQAGQTEAVLARQLAVLLQTSHWRSAVIAYEPVWAIGTGLAATPEMAQAAHAFIRAELAQADPAAAERITLLYGGSVKPDNALELFAMPDIDGGLIGGASLEADSLLAIYRAA
jgi:triosephosphate isomerase